MEGLTDSKDTDEVIKIGNGESMRGIKVGNLKWEVIQVDGNKLTVMLKEVKFAPYHILVLTCSV